MLGKVATIAGVAVAGVAAGAAAVAMSDPKTRKAVVKKVNEFKDMAQDKAEDVMDQAAELSEDVKGKIKDFTDKISEK